MELLLKVFMRLSESSLWTAPVLCLMKEMGGGNRSITEGGIIWKYLQRLYFFLLIRMIIAPDSFVLPNCSLMHKPLFLLRSTKTARKNGVRVRESYCWLWSMSLELETGKGSVLRTVLRSGASFALPPYLYRFPPRFVPLFDVSFTEAGVNGNWAADKKCANYACERGPRRALISGSIS